MGTFNRQQQQGTAVQCPDGWKQGLSALMESMAKMYNQDTELKISGEKS
jgi:hypothetical protein